jgi:hypothetical protein
VRHADEVTVMPAPPDGRGPRCELRVDGRSTCRFVAGLNLEAAVEVDGRYLVLMTDGVAQEELLSIHLVELDGRLVDTAVIGQTTTTGVFRHLVLGPPRQVGFRFLGDGPWTVEIHPRPRLAWPLRQEAPAVHRPFGWRRWFRVHADRHG